MFARLLSTSAPARSTRARRWVLALAAGSVLSALLVGAAPAGAVVSGGFGLQLRSGVSQTALYEGAPLQYHDGPVLHSSDAYVVYWDPTGSYRGDWERLIDRYFKDVGAESKNLGDVFALDGQYSEANGERVENQMTFHGSYKDEDPYPTSGRCSEPAEKVWHERLSSEPVCLTNSQIQTELAHVINSVDPPLPGVSGTPVYYLLTPPGVTVCAEASNPNTCSYSTEVAGGEDERGICGYHSVTEASGQGPIPYVVQPWVAGDAGEFIETLNPLVTSGTSAAALRCQDGVSLKEPNELDGLNPFGDYAEGLADLIVNDLSIEQRDVVTDPYLNGWYETSTDAEQGDMCQFNFGPPPSELKETPETHAVALANEKINEDSYYVSWGYNSTAMTRGAGFECDEGVNLEPYFTAPNPVAAEDYVGFNATESDLTLNAKTAGLPADEPYRAAVYTWNFGDGTPAVSGSGDASVFHAYTYGGTYEVTLRVEDSAGQVNETSRAITVVGPPPPSPEPGPEGTSGPAPTTGAAGSSATQTQGASSGPSGSSGGVTVPAPVAAATIVAQRLKRALRRGLVVTYSINEQVAGRFEVLLNGALAHRLRIPGAPATGLPAGSPAEVLIGKAILVTTKRGRGAVHIKFSKRTAARLAKLKKAPLMLRLIVRNAASSSPATTTVLSTATLFR
ncbi:MAG: PKD domain-containing protein [Solirubrobacteraceae bacterium]